MPIAASFIMSAASRLHILSRCLSNSSTVLDYAAKLLCGPCLEQGVPCNTPWNLLMKSFGAPKLEGR